MANSLSGQHEPNPALIGYPSGQLELSCPHEITRFVGFFFLLGPYGWILASIFFCELLDLDSNSFPKHAQKERGQYSAILASPFVNNPCILTNSLNDLFPQGFFFKFNYNSAERDILDDDKDLLAVRVISIHMTARD